MGNEISNLEREEQHYLSSLSQRMHTARFVSLDFCEQIKSSNAREVVAMNLLNNQNHTVSALAVKFSEDLFRGRLMDATLEFTRNNSTLRQLIIMAPWCKGDENVSEMIKKGCQHQKISSFCLMERQIEFVFAEHIVDCPHLDLLLRNINVPEGEEVLSTEVMNFITDQGIDLLENQESPFKSLCIYGYNKLPVVRIMESLAKKESKITKLIVATLPFTNAEDVINMTKIVTEGLVYNQQLKTLEFGLNTRLANSVSFTSEEEEEEFMKCLSANYSLDELNLPSLTQSLQSRIKFFPARNQLKGRIDSMSNHDLLKEIVRNQSIFDDEVCTSLAIFILCEQPSLFHQA